MKPKTEKPLKKVQALKQQKERDEQLLKTCSSYSKNR
jgi:hypothetical protein